MDRLKKMTAVCFLFVVWITLAALLSLSFFGGDSDPVGKLVSQSCCAVKDYFARY